MPNEDPEGPKQSIFLDYKLCLMKGSERYDLIAFDQVRLDADCLFQNETKIFQSVVTLKVLNLEGDVIYICSKAQEDSSYKEIPVGVILDMGSWVGKIVHSCMNMALSEFYTVNNHYKTRIVLHSRDTHGEPLHALSAEHAVVLHAVVQ
nr:extracellular ligand-binding receptor [Tanacetum cinerariifolium]